MHSLTKLGASLLLVLSAVAMPAIARDGGRGHDRDDRGGYSDRGYHDRGRDYDRRDYDRRDDRRWDDDRRGRGHGYAYGHDRYRNDSRRYYDNRRYYPAPRWNGPAYRTGYYHAPPPPRWVRGGRIYGPGYGPTYVVTDYRGYGLRYPPHGYGWRRDDHGHFLLVALATGVIADLIFHGGH